MEGIEMPKKKQIRRHSGTMKSRKSVLTSFKKLIKLGSAARFHAVGSGPSQTVLSILNAREATQSKLEDLTKEDGGVHSNG